MEAKKKEDIWQYKEYLPENSQVIVDYTKPPKDQVAFNYPVKRSYIRSVLHSGYYTFMLEWYVFNGKYIVLPLIALLLIYATAKGQTYNFLQHLDNNIKHLFLPNKEIINSNVITVTHLNYYCSQCLYWISESSYIKNGSIATNTSITRVYNDNIDGLLLSVGYSSIRLVLIIYYMFGIPLVAVLIASTEKEKLSNMIPKMNAKIFKRRMRQLTLKPEDIKENKFIIPSFANVYLDWDAKDDFSNYLEKVKVLSHPYYSRIQVGERVTWEKLNEQKRENKREKLQKERAKLNEYDFQCVFYFKEQPQNGEMKIVFY